MLKIQLLGSSVLREESTDIEESEFDSSLKELIEKMFKTMKKAKGVGLAAPQIGINKRLFVTAAPGDENRVFINPKIISYSIQTSTMEEGCLSIPGIWCDVVRPQKVVVSAYDTDGKEFTLKASGYLARVIQHEYDHLNGKVFIDYGDEETKKKALKKFAKWQNSKYVLLSSVL